MKIIDSIASPDGTVAIVQSASSNGGRKGSWVNLRLVRFQAEAWAQMQKEEIKRLVGCPGVDIIESAEVDSRNQGPRSGYGQALVMLRSQGAWKRARSAAALSDVLPAGNPKPVSVRI